MTRSNKILKKVFQVSVVFIITYSIFLSFAHAQGVPFFNGEEIKYSIRKFGVNSGEATLSFDGHQKFKGKDVYVITFIAKALNFYDEEKIYVDPNTFYPVSVERDLDIFGKKEKITENYLSDKGVVEVIKDARGKRTRQVIKKKKRIDNIYCFIYRFRMYPEPSKGMSFLMHLPTKDVQMKFEREMKLRAAGRSYNAILLESSPSKYKVWFDASQSKIPLRIDGSAGLMSTTMVMKDYNK